MGKERSSRVGRRLGEPGVGRWGLQKIQGVKGRFKVEDGAEALGEPVQGDLKFQIILCKIRPARKDVD